MFGPAADARTERLSAKLQELAAQPLKREDTAKENAGKIFAATLSLMLDWPVQEQNTNTEAEAGDESDSKHPSYPMSVCVFFLWLKYGLKLDFRDGRGRVSSFFIGGYELETTSDTRQKGDQ